MPNRVVPVWRQRVRQQRAIHGNTISSNDRRNEGCVQFLSFPTPHQHQMRVRTSCCTVVDATDGHFHEHHHCQNNCIGVVLAKLHNFCINEADAAAINTTWDSTHIIVVGGVEMMESRQANMPLPLELMHGEEHSDDLSDNELRRRRREYEDVVLLRAILHGLIETKGLTRPLPMQERH
jgi:hypothetical protein